MALSPRARRWLLALSVLVALLAIGGWWINRQLEPARLTATVLGKAGKALQLRITFDGTPDYALKPEPRLLIPNLAVSGNDGQVFLRARRAEISLPWSTLTGGEPVITRIELDTPQLDLRGLRKWQSTRPKKPFELPTLSRGLQVVNGRVSDDGYSVSELSLDLPRLKAGEPAHLSGEGNLHQDQTLVHLKVDLTAATPGLQSAFVARVSGELRQAPEPLAFTADVAGTYASNDAAFIVVGKRFKFDGASPLPRLLGKAQVAYADQLRVDFSGVLVDWPKAWPALPQPLAAATDNLPVVLSYVGKTDLSSPLSLTVTREPTELRANLVVPELRRWFDASTGSPLPPLNGSLRTPSLVFDGVELQGVQIEIGDGEATRATP